MDSDDNDDNDDVMVDDDEAESHDDEDDDDNDEEDTGSVNNKILVSLEEFTRNFRNGDYDADFDDGCSFNRGATSPDIRPTQASYNKPDNWRERNRIGLTNLKGKLQTCIRQVHDSFLPVTLELRHNSRWDEQQLMDSEEQIVWHEPILDEHWNKLEAKIFLKASKIEGIHIENVEMKKERLSALVDNFLGATSSIGCITFDNANLCEEGIISLSKLVDVSSKLRNLTFSHNWIDNMESVRCLAMALKSHTRIIYLCLNHCDLGSSPEILLVILQSDVSIIDLENNNIDSLGAVKIAEYLEGNPPIRRIDLDHNQLNDDDAILISQALKKNTNLKTLYIHTNNYTSIGVKALLTCVFDASSLNAISESNHTLARMNLCTHERDNSWLQDCIDRLLKLDCTQKIVLALQDKDSLLQYLANVPVGLIPDVLAFPLRQFDNQPLHKHLNIIYSTMRWWNMPMLYSYHICDKSDTKKERDDKRKRVN